MAGAFLMGGLASVVPMAFMISFFEGGAQDPTGIDGDLYGTIPMALLGGLATWLLRRRPVAVSFAFGWVVLQTAFTLTFSENEVLVASLLPALWATLLWDLAPPLRLALALPAVLVFMLSADLIASQSTVLAMWSGVIAVLLGAVYFVGWAVRERERWANHLAWGIAAAWATLAFILALSDLFEYLDGVAIAGAGFTLGLLCCVGFGWVASQVRLARLASSPLSA